MGTCWPNLKSEALLPKIQEKETSLHTCSLRDTSVQANLRVALTSMPHIAPSGTAVEDVGKSSVNSSWETDKG